MAVKPNGELLLYPGNGDGDWAAPGQTIATGMG
jgi:hypothetical protein